VKYSGHFDFAIVGSGFAGSIMSMVLRRLGYSVLLLERNRHPRFAIGESSTPFANLLLETVAARYDLPFLKSLSEWGSWQREHPQIACGLKRGFTFYHHTPGQSLDLSNRENQLLVAASPNDEVADTHWFRPDFDAFLVQKARELDVTYLDEFEPVIENSWQLRGSKGTFTANFLIDASGAHSRVAETLGITREASPCMPATRTIYAHFRNLPRLVLDSCGAPYPPDDAAVHHFFAEGWMWVLRFNNGIISAGFALKSTCPDSWNTLLSRYPSLEALFQHAEPITKFYSAEPLSFRRNRAVGENFALLPGAAGFVDPLLSTGFALSLLGILRLGEIFARPNNRSEALATYEAQTLAELDAPADLVSALYSKLHSPAEFFLLTKLYFAALSFTETCWRLGRPELASGFLLTNDHRFSRNLRGLCDQARSGEPLNPSDVHRVIEPYDIAGLIREDRRNWYPVNPSDLLKNRSKVGASLAEIETMFRKLKVSL
jgi:tetracycline 7-halogenase / FADH2 O2-dependent halogenase